MLTLELSRESTPGKFSTYLAIASFSIGTLLLVIHLCVPDELSIYVVGYFYVILAAFINGLMLMYLFYHFIFNQPKREILAIRMLILMANIPIAYVYALIALNNF